MKGDPKGTPKLTAVGKEGGVSVDSRASKEFQKYAAMGLKPSRRAPNTMVKGRRNMNPTELVQQYKGDPEAGTRSGTPYYDVYQQQRRAAESPVSKENIPAAMRRQVKEYFEGIKP
jgi:hypothetical protein